MIEKLRRVVKRSGYSRGVRPRKVEPIRRDPELDRWIGMWIAVKDGEVIAAANNSNELVRMVIEMGPRGTGAVAQFVPKRQDSIVIGVG